MGVNNPKDFSFRSIPLSFDQVLHVIHELNKENCNVSGGASRAPNSSLVSTQNESCHPPMVDIDANNVAFKYFLSRKTSPVHGIIQLADLFVNNDTDVCVVADGKLRHDTKRESTTRKVKIELAKLRVSELQHRLMYCLQQGCGDAEAEGITKQLQKAEKQATKVLPESFVEDLKEEIQLHSTTKKGTLFFKKTAAQADPLIAKRSIDGKSTIIWSNDSDFIVHNPKTLQIFDCSINTSGKVSNIILATGSIQTASSIDRILKSRFVEVKKKDSFTFSVPKYPLFQKEKDPYCRALLASAIGNDYWESGQQSFGSSHAWSILQSSDIPCDGESRRDFIAQKIADLSKNGTKCTKSIRVFAEALLYEPANEEGEEITYIHDDNIPLTLPFYLRAYKCPGLNDVIDNGGVEVLLCHSVFSQTHEFLKEEGWFTCKLCSNTTCRHCCNQNDEFHKICIPCHTTQTTQAGDNIKSQEEMIKELMDSGHNFQKSNMTYLTTLELYERYKEFNLGLSEIRNNKYPLMETKEIHDKDGPLGHQLYECQLRDLAAATRSSDLSPANIMSLIHLLAELVRYDISSVSGKIYPIHKNMPAILTKFCEGSRMGDLGGGLRLLARANRHATYQYEPHIGNAILKIGLFEGKVYLNLSKEVCKSYHPGSNKDERMRYVCTCVFSAEDLLCTECTCPSGALDPHDKHTCVHNPSLLRGLNLELYKGLAEQILIEFGVRVKSEDSDIYNCHEMRKSISLLATAAGEKLSTEMSLNDMLGSFSVGTDRSKQYPGDPSPEFLRPIRDVLYVSPSKKTEDITSLKWRHKSEEMNIIQDDMATSPLPFEDELITMSLSSDAMRHLISRKYRNLKAPNNNRRPIGIQKMKLGAQKAILKRSGGEMDVDDCILVMEKEWEKAFALTTSRSHPLKNTKFLDTHKTKRCSRNDSFVGGRMQTRSQTKASKDNNPRSIRKRKNEYQQTQMEKKRGRVGELSSTTTTTTTTTTTKKSEKGRITNGHKCCMVGCSNSCTYSMGPIRYKRVPPFKSKLTKEEAMKTSAQSQITAWRKCKTRQKILDRLGLSMSCEEQELRYCESHEVEPWVLQSYKIPIYKSDGSLTHVSKKFKAIDIPKPLGKLSALNTSIGSSKKNKGLSYDRAAIRILDNIDVTSDSLAHQQAWEMQDVSQKKHALTDINPTVVEKAGLDVHKDNESFNNNRKRTRTNENVPVDRNVKYRMSECTPKTINALTGSIDLPGILEEIIVICGGDFNLITKTQSYMTWLEEWLFFFGFVYGRQHVRWEDFCNTWSIRKQTLRSVLGTKLKLALESRNRWPMYSNLEECEALRDGKWDVLLGKGKYRIVMHDNTNIGVIPKPSASELNSATWSQYYASNTCKGGVAIQDDGWIRSFEPYVGAISDSLYVEKTKILSLQQKFSEEDHSSNIPFTNIFDKGYRLTLKCMETGGQLVWQPMFARSDRRYGSFGVNLSAVVASTRSGNERAVKMMKHSWLLKRGYVNAQHFDLSLLADVWLAWGFLVNFKYSPVH